MPKKYWKVVANATFLVAVFLGTFYLIFRDQEISAVIDSIQKVKYRYLSLGIILTLSFVCSESVIIHLLFKTIKEKVSLLRCIKYSFVGFFFSAVTPSATGGQPMQILWMKRDNISVAKSTIVLMLVTATYKIVLLLMCGIASFFECGVIQQHAEDIWFLIVFGIVCNVSFVIFLLVAIFRGSWVTRTIGKTIFWLGKHHIIKNREKWLRKAWSALGKYDTSAVYLKQNKQILFHVLLITVFQRLCLFSVTYVVYFAFGLRGTSAFEIIALQTIIALAVDSLPLPGGMGASESSFLIIFLTIFGEEFVLPGMLLSRGITYYVMIIISALITVISYGMAGRMNKNESGGL